MALTVGTDSYITVADADAYMDTRLYATAWAVTDSDKEKALKMATRAIDRITLRGIKKTIAQDLAFPRCYLWGDKILIPDPDDTLLGIKRGAYLCETEVPQPVLDATCEEALALLDRGNASRYRLQADGVESFSLGNLSETYRTGVGRPELVSPEARDFLRHYKAGAVRIS